MATQSRRPGRTGYVVAAIVALIGLIASVLLIAYVVVSILNLDDDLQRIVVPGTTEVELEETGRYTIFYEYRSTVQGREYRTGERLPDLAIEVTSVETGDEVPVSSSFENVSYDFWTRAGESYATFRIDDPGAYEITAEYADGRDGPDVVLALGEGIGTAVLLSVGAAIGSGVVFCGTMLIAMIVLIITLIRRNRVSQAGSAPAARTG